jgi:hypothetical protein
VQQPRVCAEKVCEIFHVVVDLLVKIPRLEERMQRVRIKHHELHCSGHATIFVPKLRGYFVFLFGPFGYVCFNRWNPLSQHF